MVLKYFHGAKCKVSGHFNIILPDFDLLEAILGLLAVESLRIMIFRSKLIDHLKMVPRGSLSNFKSIGHRLTVHQSVASSSQQNQVYYRQDPTQLQNSNKSMCLVLFIAQEVSPKISSHPTSFDPVLASNGKSAPLRDKSQTFPENKKLCPLICMAYHQVFCRKIMPKIIQKYQENFHRRKKQKKPEDGRKTATKRAKCPMVASNPGNPGRQIFVKNPFWVPFRVSSYLAFVIFQKSDFRHTKSIDHRQHHEFAVQIMGSSSDTSKSLTGRQRKHTFYPTDQEIDKTDGTGPLVEINV